MPATPPPLRALFLCYDRILNPIPIGKKFDSHWFIQKLTKAHQTEYISALTHYSRCRGPFKTLHRLLANELNGKTQVRKTKARPRNADVFFGDDVSNTEWIRV